MDCDVSGSRSQQRCTNDLPVFRADLGHKDLARERAATWTDKGAVGLPLALAAALFDSRFGYLGWSDSLRVIRP